MINNNQTTPEVTTVKNTVNNIDFEDLNNFEPVKLNIPEQIELDDENISSLFGDKNFSEINPFVYEKELLTKTKFARLSSIIDNVNGKKIKIAVACTIVLVGALTVGATSFKFEQSNFIADASPIPQITSQNINAKTISIKEQINQAGFLMMEILLTMT